MLSSQKFHQFKSYLNYWLESVDEHSLHGPFMFSLYRDVIKTDNYQPIFDGFEQVRDSLKNSQRVLDVQDFGAGSSVTKSSKRKVSEIARLSLTPAKTSRLYYRLIERFNLVNVLELGTSLGINAMYMASVPSVQKLYTIEGDPKIAKIANDNFSGYSNNKIELLNKPISQALDRIFNRISQLDLILFDAHHTYEATWDYYSRCKPYLHQHSVLIFDDIHWSKGMEQAWEQIKQEIEVTLTADLYYFGLVFFKKDLEKEDFTLSW